MKALQVRIIPRSDHGTDEQRAPHAFATATDEGFAAPLAGLAGIASEGIDTLSSRQTQRTAERWGLQE